MRKDEPLKAIFLVLLGVTLFALSNASIKATSEFLSTAQILLFRNIIYVVSAAIGIFLVFPKSAVGHFKTGQIKKHIFRAFCGNAGMAAIFYAFGELRLANATVLLFSSVIFGALFGHTYFREKLSSVQWVGVGVGFLGIILAVAYDMPLGGLFEIAAVVMLIGAFLDAVQVTMPRILSRTESLWTLMFWYGLFCSIFSFPFFFLWGWRPLEGLGLKEWSLVLLLSLTSFFGQLCMTRAFSITSAGVAAPFIYFLMLPSALFGYLFWGEVPQLLTWAGFGLLACSGTLIALSERWKSNKEKIGIS